MTWVRLPALLALFTILLVLPPAGQAQIPLSVISNSTLGFGVVGWKYSQGLDAMGGAYPYRWSLAGGALPPGITVNTNIGLEGTPTSAGTYSFTIRVTDQVFAQATKLVSLDIISLGASQPAITTSFFADGVAGLYYDENLDALGGTPPYGWTVVSGSLPVGLQSGRTFGEVWGTPTTPGTSTFTVRATDANNNVKERQFSITIRSGNTTRIQTTTRLGGIFEAGFPWTFNLAASGGTAPYLWSLGVGSLPLGMTLNSTGSLTGQSAVPGTFHFRLRATDAKGLVASKDITYFVAPQLSSAWTPAFFPSTAVVNVPFPQTRVQVSSGVPPITLGVTDVSGQIGQDNTLLPNLKFDPTTGTFAGTPLVPGTYLFTLELRQTIYWWANSYYNYSALPLTVYPPVSTSYSIGPQWLPYGTVNVSYSQTLSVAGGSSPYTWAITSGALPTGLTLNSSTGAITGTPVSDGATAFTVQVTDRNGAAVQRAYVLRNNSSVYPTVGLSGFSDAVSPASQASVRLDLASPYSAAIQGTLFLRFSPNAANNSDDPSVQFSTGGRTVNFTIPAGSTQANFGTSDLKVQTGTVAGYLGLEAWLFAGSLNLAPYPTPQRSASVPLQATTIQSVTVSNNSGSAFDVEVIGFSTSRELTQASFSFFARSGYNMQGGSASIDLRSSSAAYFQGSASSQFGGQFKYVQHFTMSQGSTGALASVSVSVSNQQGSSSSSTASF